MRQAELRGPARLVVGQLAEIIMKTLHGAPVEPGPESSSQTARHPAVTMAA